MEEYTLVLESQLGPRQGCLRLNERDGAVTGTLTLLEHDNAVRGERTGAHTLYLRHYLRTAVSDLDCVSDLEIEHGQLRGMLYSGHTVMPWHGEQQTGENSEEDNDA